MSAPRRWIRLDVDWEDSPWLDALDGIAAGYWPRILCLMKRSGVGGAMRSPDLGVLARRWRVPIEALAALVAAAEADGALVATETGWAIPKWDDYQKPDLTAADRMKRYRKDKSRLSPLRRNTVTDRNVTPGDDVTRRVTETLTETSTTTSSVEVEFSKAWTVYPKRFGGNPRKLALEAFTARVKEGIEPQDLIEATERYRKHIESTGKTGTEYVLQASTFFGPKERWKDEYHANGNGQPAYHRLRLEEL